MPTDARPRPASPPLRRPPSTGTSASRRATVSSCRPTSGVRPTRRRPARAGDPRDDPVRQGQLAAQRGHRPAASGSRRAATRSCRVDVRGTGSSGGVALDEYTEDETRDGYDAVEWLAAQPWCTGAVGMWGISYGGVHRDPGRQAAARRTSGRSCRSRATDDRYLTDVHYIGGCVTASELSQYAVSQVAMNAMPPDAGVPRRRLARRVARAPRGDAAVAHRVAAPADRRAVLAARLAGARLRRHRGGDPQRRRLVRRVCRRGVPDAGAMHGADRGRSSATGSTAGRTTRRRARTSTSSTRSSGSSIAGSRASRNGARRRAGGRLVRAGLRGAGAVPRGVARALAGGDGLPAPGDRRCVRGGSTAERCRWSARLVGRRGATATARRRPYRHRRDGRHRAAALSWGAGGDAERPRARPPAGREPRADLHERARSTSRCPILGEPVVVLHLAVDAPVATAVVRLTDVAPDGTSAWVSCRHPEPDPSPVGHGPGAARARARSRRSGSRCGTPAIGSRRDIGSGSRWRRRPGRSSGRRRIPATFELHRGPATPSRLDPAGHPARPAVRATCRSRRSRRRRRTLRAVGGEGASRRAAVADRGGRHRAARRPSRSTTAARTSSRTAGACTPPRPCD